MVSTSIFLVASSSEIFTMHLIFFSLIISFIFGQNSSISAHSASILETTLPDFTLNFETEIAPSVLENLSTVPVFYNLENQNNSFNKRLNFELEKAKMSENAEIQRKTVLASVKNQLSSLPSVRKALKENPKTSETLKPVEKPTELIRLNSSTTLQKEQVESIPENLISQQKYSMEITENHKNSEKIIYFRLLPDDSKENGLALDQVKLQKILESDIQKPAQNSQKPVDSVVIAPKIPTIIQKSSTQSSQASSQKSVETVKQATPKIQELTNLSTKSVASSSIFSQVSQTKSSLEAMIIKRCQELGCDSVRMLKVMQCESEGRNVASPAGHIGPFQFTQRTFYAFAKQYGLGNVNIWEPSDQVEVATRMFAEGLGKQHWSCYR